MDISQIARDPFNTLREWENRLLEFLQPTVRKTEMIVYICFICHMWLVFQGLLHRCDAFLELLMCIVCQTLLVKDP